MTTTTKQLIRFIGVALTLGLGLGACAPADPPVHPSFATDILPVMEAHCTRCHGGNGTLTADPGGTSSMALFRGAPLNGYFTQYEDKTGCPTAQCAGAKTLAASIKVYVHNPKDLRMPPPPSDPLSDWELKLIDNWAANPAP